MNSFSTLRSLCQKASENASVIWDLGYFLILDSGFSDSFISNGMNELFNNCAYIFNNVVSTLKRRRLLTGMT